MSHFSNARRLISEENIPVGPSCLIVTELKRIDNRTKTLIAKIASRMWAFTQWNAHSLSLDPVSEQ